jgi:hypothetical protein
LVSDKVVSDEKRVAASVIMSFYETVNSLSHHYAIYDNGLLELKARYGLGDDDTGTPEEAKEKIIEQCQTVRYYCTRANILVLSMADSLKLEEKVKEDVKLAYGKIKQNLIPKRADVEEYVTILNCILISEVIKTLVDSSSDVLEAAYGKRGDRAESTD